jgi:hypothetical protein
MPWPPPREHRRISIIQAAAGRAADLENDLADALDQRRRRARDQPVARALIRRAAAIDRIALALGADESQGDGVQTVVPFAGGDRETLLRGLP